VTLNILLVQDDPTEANSVQDALVNSSDGPFQVEWMRTAEQGLERLLRTAEEPGRAKHGIAAILLDLALPNSSGTETFDRFLAAAPQCPILVLCSGSDEETAKEAVKRGAQDYLLKGHLDAYLLPKALCNMIKRATNAEALFEEQERARVTLNSIGDAVMTSDVWGRVTYLNSVANELTGWSGDEAKGRPLEEVFRIVDATTREPTPNPMLMAIAQNETVGLTPNCLLVRRDGVEFSIEDSAAPIHDRRGTVTGAVMVFRDVTTSQALSRRMAYLAQHDGLTNLPNRTLLNDRLDQAISLADRHGGQLALLYLDLDRFKHVNDSLGHAIGDRLLQSVGERLTHCVRRTDTVSRQGGDEFVVLLADIAHAPDAGISAAKILEALRAPHVIGEHSLHATASIGIATYPGDGTDPEILHRNADSAMYHAKKEGRDNYQFFTDDMNTLAVERQSVEAGLRTALERQEFELRYQPKISIATGAIVGVEALVRWRHPQRGLMTPAEFIPIAEETGLIVPMGRWILREACRQARAWQDAGLPPLSVAINVSAVELRGTDFVAGVQAILAETGLDPRYLELELTETFLMLDTVATVDVLRALKALGVSLALDDFGTGYSSLSNLQKFPINTLKIDRSFVRDMTTDAGDASIVEAVLAMGRSLKMNVVAEGIEARHQLAYLRQHQCPQGQGFYFSRPVAATEFGSLVEFNAARIEQALVNAPPSRLSSPLRST
jgi:diguanylate cyclase (GGDEF)-like protein/PAS domain S-box-containing protein